MLKSVGNRVEISIIKKNLKNKYILKSVQNKKDCT